MYIHIIQSDDSPLEHVDTSVCHLLIPFRFCSIPHMTTTTSKVDIILAT